MIFYENTDQLKMAIMVNHYKDNVLKDSIKRVKLLLPLSVHLCKAASKAMLVITKAIQSIWE